MDRLGRSLREMLNTAHVLQERGVKLRSLTENADTETPNGKLMFNFLGTIAEYFLDLNRERTMEGLKAALARGRKGGRPPKVSDADLEAGRAMLAAGTISVAEIAKRLGISRKTFYQYFLAARGRARAGMEPRAPARRPAWSRAHPRAGRHGAARTRAQAGMEHQEKARP